MSNPTTYDNGDQLWFNSQNKLHRIDGPAYRLAIRPSPYEKEGGDKAAGSAEKPAAEEVESEETGNEGYVPAGMVVSQYDTGPKNLLPKQYADQQETPLTAAVRAEENSIDFDLSK